MGYERDIRPEYDWRVDWGSHQVCTTTNFVPDVLTGICNDVHTSALHLEHHLFPRVNPRHLWRVTPLLKDTCSEFSLRYAEVNRAELQRDLSKFAALRLDD